MLKLFDGACHKTEPHVCISRSHWPLWERFVDWIIVSERILKANGVDGDFKPTSIEAIARIYRHQIFFDLYVMKKLKRASERIKENP